MDLSAAKRLGVKAGIRLTGVCEIWGVSAVESHIDSSVTIQLTTIVKIKTDR